MSPIYFQQPTWVAAMASSTPVPQPTPEHPNLLLVFLVAAGLLGIYVWGQTSHAARTRDEGGDEGPPNRRAGASGTLHGLFQSRNWRVPDRMAELLGPPQHERARTAPESLQPAFSTGAAPAARCLPLLATPEGAHGLSALTAATGPRWDEIVAATRFAAGERCEACEATTRLSVYPVWRFEDRSRRQRLLGLMALCEACAHAAHDIETEGAETAARFAELNGWTPEVTRAVLSKARRDRDRRASASWVLDLDWLEDLPPRPRAS